MRVNQLKAGGQSALIQFHGQVLRLEVGFDGGVLPIDREGEAVRQAQIVLDFAKGVEYRRPVSVFHLAIGRPGPLQLSAPIATLEGRQGHSRAIGPHCGGQLGDIEAGVHNPSVGCEPYIGEKGGAGNADGAVRLRHPTLHRGDVGPPLEQRGWDASRNRELRHSKLVRRFDLETGRRHIDEDGDRLLGHLTLALNLRVFGLRAVQDGLGAGDIERGRDRAGELGFDEL